MMPIKIAQILALLRMRKSAAFIGLIIISGSLMLLLLLMGKSRDSTYLQRVGIKVQVLKLQPTSERIKLSGYGNVEPSKVVDITPQTSGHVVEMSPSLIEGGRVPVGELLVQIDRTDYEIELERRKAELVNAQAEMRLEQGNQMVAKHEWKMLKKDLGERNVEEEELALRVPYLRQKEAYLQSAEINVKKGELDLERTSVYAPFNALILSETVEVGGLITSPFPIAKVASTDEFQVKVLVPEEAISAILTASNGEVEPKGSEVLVIPQSGGNRANARRGKFSRLLGSVDSNGRMAQILVSIPDPLDPVDGAPPLLLGSYVRVELTAGSVSNVIKFPRRLMDEQNRTYVVDSHERLRIRKVEPLFTDEDFVIARNSFPQGDRIITSAIKGSLEGSRVEIESESNEP